MVFWVCAASTHGARAAAGNVCICVCNNFAWPASVCALANKPFAASKQHVTINLVSAAVVGL